MPAFLCSVPLPVSRHLFLFCRMLSGLFVCLFRRRLLLNYQLPGASSRLTGGAASAEEGFPPITNHQLPITNNHIMVICWLYAGHVLVICYTLLITSRGSIRVQRVPLWRGGKACRCRCISLVRCRRLRLRGERPVWDRESPPQRSRG